MGAIASRIGIAVALAAFLALVFVGREGAQATAFDPVIAASVTDPTPGGVSDIDLQLSIPAPDYNFDAIITFIPAGFHIAADADVPDGALAGRLNAQSTLGLFNNGCNTALPVTFDLLEASTDTNSTIPLYSGGADYNGDGVVENVKRYPDFLTRLTPGLQPIQRLYGQQLVAGVPTYINFVIFQPGAAIPRVPALDPSLGYPTMVFLNDPASPTLQSNINDFCTPLGTDLVDFGTSRDNPSTAANEAGSQLLRNPDAAGQYSFVSFIRSQWDSEGDGIENKLDPCPYSADPNWDPRAFSPAADADGNGIPSSCDAAGQVGTDVDGDGFSNRLDNCPFISNPVDTDTDMDGIGDVCDHFPEDPTDGGTAQREVACLPATVQIGAGGPAASPPVCPTGDDLPVPLALSAAPQSATLARGTVNSLYASVFDPLAQTGMAAVTVNFQVSGANQASGSCLTDNYGSCVFNYAGANLGDDAILVTATANGQDLTANATARWVNPPPNDNFADAATIDGLPFTGAAQTAASSSEANEPHACVFLDSTVWFKFVPAQDEFLRIEAGDVDVYAFVGLLEGTLLGNLQTIGCAYSIPAYGYDAPTAASEPLNEAYVFASVQAGHTYFIQVAGGPQFFDSGGSVPLTVKQGQRGDIDCDNTVDAVDVLNFLRAEAGLSAAVTCFRAGDFDCSGSIDTTDLLDVLKIANAMPVNAPPCNVRFNSED